jgi:hypothetical protein
MQVFDIDGLIDIHRAVLSSNVPTVLVALLIFLAADNPSGRFKLPFINRPQYCRKNRQEQGSGFAAIRSADRGMRGSVAPHGDMREQRLAYNVVANAGRRSSSQEFRTAGRGR